MCVHWLAILISSSWSGAWGPTLVGVLASSQNENFGFLALALDLVCVVRKETGDDSTMSATESLTSCILFSGVESLALVAAEWAASIIAESDEKGSLEVDLVVLAALGDLRRTSSSDWDDLVVSATMAMSASRWTAGVVETRAHLSGPSHHLFA